MLDAAVKAVNGKVEDKEAFQKAIRAVKLQNSLRGPVHFDEFGNVVGNIYIRQVDKVGNIRQRGGQDLSERRASSGPTTRTSS